MPDLRPREIEKPAEVMFDFTCFGSGLFLSLSILLFVAGIVRKPCQAWLLLPTPICQCFCHQLRCCGARSNVGALHDIAIERRRTGASLDLLVVARNNEEHTDPSVSTTNVTVIFWSAPLELQQHDWLSSATGENMSSAKSDLMEQSRQHLKCGGETEDRRFSGLARLYSTKITEKICCNHASYRLGLNNRTSYPMSSSMTSDVVLERLCKASVVVVGLGGVGSWAAEALCRSGIGHLILVDFDDICISNTNRQLHTLSTTVGNLKIDEMKRRLQSINPSCHVTLIHDFVTPSNVQFVLHQVTSAALRKADKIVCLDAMDAVDDKSALISGCAERGIPIVTCGGAAGKRNPTMIASSDLSDVTDDRLLRSCRKTLRENYGFERGLPFQQRKKLERQQQQEKVQSSFRTWNVEAVYSTELLTSLTHSTMHTSKSKSSSSFRRCDGTLGTACFITGTFGFVAASRVVNMIATDNLVPPRKR